MLVGSGKAMSIRQLIYHAFNYRKLNYKNYIKVDKKLFRKIERNQIVGSMYQTCRLLKKWHWKPKIIGKKLVYKMCQNFY